MSIRIILFLSLFISYTTFSFNKKNEIVGKFIYDTDIKKNELYVLNNKLELNTYNIESGILKNSLQIITDNTEELGNMTWSGLYDSFNLNSDVVNGLLSSLVLKKIEDDKFYLFHDGGGLIIEIKGNQLVRKDNSFPFMNKFFGDFISFENNLYHFGGYGLFRSNNSMLFFDEGNSNQWEEITSNGKIPDEISNGLASFHPLLIDSNYYVLGGNSSFNNTRFFNQSLLIYNFTDSEWNNLGEVNLDFSENPLIISSESCYYIFDKNHFYQIQLLKNRLLRFEYQSNFNVEYVGQSFPFNRNNKTFLSISQKGEEFGIVSMNNYDNKFIHTFRPHNGKMNTSILNKYRLDEIIDVNSMKEIPLFTIEQSRNQFFIPLLIVLGIIIVNLLYKGIKKDVKRTAPKLFTFEEDELLIMGTKINIDNNALEILKMLHENEEITSNDIVAKLVENGLSYDYASKVKNKIIESLNEKFEFITRSGEPFINISKSSQDKRIQILSLIKS